MTQSERRREPRAPERITFAVADAGTVLQAQTNNLSASGAYCTMSQFIAPMTKLQLQFELPDGARRIAIRCGGVVVRIEPVITTTEHSSYHVAIFFNDITEQNRAAISRFVQQRLSAATRSTR